MANININNLSGSDLFNDSESFMVDITDDTDHIVGGAASRALTVRITRALIDALSPAPKPDDTGLMDPDE
jgi:hypothetical protein